ncbi:MAG TPA: hypothetical protein VK327_16460 [Candidatus Paceibacterota bacterium]|nr:hypothetical protein [Candidatus Paceibacterota bacterium]
MILKLAACVLVIDDEPQIRRPLRVTLEGNGWHAGKVVTRHHIAHLWNEIKENPSCSGILLNEPGIGCRLVEIE